MLLITVFSYDEPLFFSKSVGADWGNRCGGVEEFYGTRTSGRSM